MPPKREKRGKQPSLSGYPCSDSRKGKLRAVRREAVSARFSCRCRPVWRLSGRESRCRRSSLGNQAVEVVDDVAVALHVDADVVVVADIAENDPRAEEMAIVRQRDVGRNLLERPVSEELAHLVHGGHEAVCADHLDLARTLKLRDAV